MIYRNNDIQINFTDTTKKGVTGTTIQTVLGVIPISANTFQNYDTFFVEGLFVSSATSATLRIYVNTGQTVTSSATQIMIRGVSSGLVTQIQERTINIIKSDGNVSEVSPDIGTNFAASGTGIVTDFRSTTATIASIDWTKDNYIFFTAALGLGATNYIDQYYIKVWTE